MNRNFKHHVLFVCSFALVLFQLNSNILWAGRKDPGLNGNSLTIEKVSINFDPLVSNFGRLTITGNDFDFGNTLLVTLGEEPMVLTIVSTSPTVIVVDLPKPFPPGDYLLTVSTGNGPTLNDEYDLTLGAISLGNCAEGEVIQSIDANGIATCVVDMHVKGTVCPAGQVATGYDANGAIQCKVDQDTDTRAEGSCPTGQVVSAINADGTVTCIGVVMHFEEISCPEGYVLTGVSENGEPQCQPLSVNNDSEFENEFPCSSGTPVGDRWVVSSSGRTVCDKDTHITWVREPETFGGQNWENSIAYCQSLGTGWELPELEVLRTLLDETSTKCNPGQSDSICLSEGHPFQIQSSSNTFWTATDSLVGIANPDYAYFINFQDASQGTSPKSDARPSWCMR